MGVLMAVTPVSAQVLASGEPSVSGAIEHLTTAAFREKVSDYTESPQEFKYKGKIKVYKVNIDKEPELAQVFGVQSIPLMLFLPVDSQPAVQPGLLQKAQLTQIVDEFLLK